MRVTFKSTRLLDELSRRQREFNKRISATLVVPEELRWWFFHEFGTATHNERNPSGAYTIVPVSAPYLKFPDPSGVYGSSFGLDFHDGFARRYKVVHPGVRPRHMVTTVLEDIGRMAKSELAHAMVSSRYSRDAVKARLTEYVMQQAKNIIVQSISEKLPGTREDGKLQGRTAAEEFELRSTIRPN